MTSCQENVFGHFTLNLANILASCHMKTRRKIWCWETITLHHYSTQVLWNTPHSIASGFKPAIFSSGAALRGTITHAGMFGTEFRSPHIHVHVYTRQVLRRIYRCTTEVAGNVTLLAAMEVTRNRESRVNSCPPPPKLQLCGTTCKYMYMCKQ